MKEYNKKVLVAGPEFHGYVGQIANAFASVGCNSKFVTYNPHPYFFSFFQKGILLKTEIKEALYVTKKDPQKYSEMHDPVALIRYHKNLQITCESFKPDLCIFIRPDLLTNQLLSLLRKLSPHCLMIIWATDPIQRIRVDIEILKSADYVFLYDSTEVPFALTLQANAVSLPVGFDDFSYKPPKNVYKNSNKISFIGRLSPERVDDIAYLIANLNLKPGEVDLYIGKELFFVRIKHMLQKNKPPMYYFRISGHVRAPHAASIYQNSLISLNIHQLGTIAGYNPRFFEIPGSGGFEIARYLPGMENYFEPDKEMVFYKSQEELVDLAKFYFCNERTRQKICLAGARRAHACHTYVHRVLMILKILYK